MTDELKQLTAQCRERLSETVDSNQEEHVLMEAFREVQRQTVEAAAKIAHDYVECKELCEQCVTAESIEKAIRALLSPAQEVRNG